MEAEVERHTNIWKRKDYLPSSYTEEVKCCFQVLNKCFHKWVNWKKAELPLQVVCVDEGNQLFVLERQTMAPELHPFKKIWEKQSLICWLGCWLRYLTADRLLEIRVSSSLFFSHESFITSHQKKQKKTNHTLTFWNNLKRFPPFTTTGSAEKLSLLIGLINCWRNKSSTINYMWQATHKALGCHILTHRSDLSKNVLT